MSSSSISNTNHDETATTTTTSQNEATALVLRIAVGSNNPVKVQAVRRALERIVKQSEPRRHEPVHIQISSFDVPSGVSAQPFGDEETQRGAKNRAKAAYEAYRVANPQYRRPHLAIGVEGGLEWSNTILDDDGSATLWCMAWMAVIGKRSNLLAECLASSDSKFYPVDPQPVCGFAKTSTFLLPKAITKLVQENGMELGHADDQVFDRVNSKQQSGTVGVLTDGIIDRTEYYQSALILALVPWIRPDVYVVPPNTKTVEENHDGAAETKGTDDSPDESGTTTTTSSFLGILFGVSTKP